MRFCLCPSVSVGFEYESCPDLILWEKRTAVLQGYETTASKLGGWTIDKHHALNIQSGESAHKAFLNYYSHPLFQIEHLLRRHFYTARNLHFYTLFVPLLSNHLSLQKITKLVCHCSCTSFWKLCQRLRQHHTILQITTAYKHLQM